MATSSSIVVPGWHEYFMRIAGVVKTRGNCMLRQVGVVLVRNRQIIATGYNGTPRGVTNCLDGGCVRCHRKLTGKIKSGEDKGMCLCVHAEANAIIQSAYHGIATRGAQMYSTTSPCLLCAKEIINAGIEAVYYEHQEPGESTSLALLRRYLRTVRRVSSGQPRATSGEVK